MVRGSMEGGKTPSVGSKCMMTRRIGGAERELTSELTKFDPPTSWTVHGIDGAIRAIVNVTVEPLDAGAQSRVRIELDFEEHGIGKLLVPPRRAPTSTHRDARQLRPAKATTRGEREPRGRAGTGIAGGILNAGQTSLRRGFRTRHRESGLAV